MDESSDMSWCAKHLVSCCVYYSLYLLFMVVVITINKYIDMCVVLCVDEWLLLLLLLLVQCLFYAVIH